MKSTRYLVSATAELAACVEDGEYHRHRRDALLVLDADADHAITRCAAQTETKESLLAAMEADSTLSPTLKQAVIENVLKGRFFD